MLKVLDNFLSVEQHAAIEATMLGDNFPWFYSPTKVKTVDPDNPYNYQFTHMIYDNYIPMSQMWPELDPIIRRLNAQAWLRTKANLTPRTETPYEYGMHVDIDDFHGITGVYYVNTNNGLTRFEDGREIKSIANRLVLFDSAIKHSGVSCTDEKVRCVINFNYLPNPTGVHT